MAGRGRRFIDNGYLLPKPLINIDGKPMIYRVIDSLPKSNKWIFIVREEHINEFKLDKVILNKISDAIILVDKDLLGGASIFCAEKYLDLDEEVLISGCDNAFIFNQDKFDSLKSGDASCILWTFTNDKRIARSPNSWGYVVLDKNGQTIKDMSVKIPISDNPIEDHAVTATFFLRSAKILYNSLRLMIRKNIKTNGEFYLDNLPIILNMMNEKSIIFDVDLYVGWGTPEELHEFEKILHNYKLMNLDSTFNSNSEKKLWMKYFCDFYEEK